VALNTITLTPNPHEEMDVHVVRILLISFNGKNMFLLSVLAAAGGTGQFAVSTCNL
jgi:hypothetical protein